MKIEKKVIYFSQNQYFVQNRSKKDGSYLSV